MKKIFLADIEKTFSLYKKRPPTGGLFLYLNNLGLTQISLGVF